MATWWHNFIHGKKNTPVAPDDIDAQITRTEYTLKEADIAKERFDKEFSSLVTVLNKLRNNRRA